MNSLETLLALSAVVAISTRAILALQPTEQEIAVRHPGLIQLREFSHGLSHSAAPKLFLAVAKHRNSDDPNALREARAVTATAAALH